jgi:hypothetical protein
MNKSSLIKAKSEFENSPYVQELNLDKSVAFMMHVNDKVSKLQGLLKELKASPTLNIKKVEDVMNGLTDMNALVASVMSKGLLTESAAA